MSYPTNQNAYVVASGTSSTGAIVVYPRSPTSNDTQSFKVGQFWLDSSTPTLWYLSSFSQSAGILQATWTEVQGGFIDSFTVDAFTAPGTNPVVPDGAGLIAITGAQVATGTVGTNVIRTDSLAANSITIEIQRTTTAAAADADLNGVCHFDSSQFAVDSDGFVTLSGGGAAIDSFTVPSGTSPVVPDGAGNVDLPAGNGFAFTGGTNAMTGNMVSPFTGAFTFSGIVTSESSFNVAPGSDTDTDVITVAVTGTPTLEWDETQNGFRFITGLMVGDTVGSLSHQINGVTVGSDLEISSQAAQDLGGLTIHRHSDTALYGGHIVNLRSDGTHASPTIVQDGDVLGRYIGAGYDGTDYSLCAEFRIEVDGTPGANDMPGRFVFLTSPDGSQTPAEALRISQDKTISFTNYTQNSLSYFGASGLVTEIGPLTNGQLIIGSSGSVPVASNLTAGAGISIANGAGSVTIAATGSGFAWADQSGAFNATSDAGFFITATSTATLPASPTNGDTIEFIVNTTDVLTIQASGTQIIRIGNAASSAGGTAVSSGVTNGDSLALIYRSTNDTWLCLSAPQGVWAVA